MSDSYEYLILVYNIALLIFFTLPYIVNYFKTKSFSIAIPLPILIRMFMISLVFFSGFIIIDQLSQSETILGFYLIRQSSVFLWLNLFLLVGYLIFLSYIWDVIYVQTFFIKSKLPSDALKRLFQKTGKNLGFKSYRLKQTSEAEAYIEGGYFTKFDVFFENIEEPKKGFIIQLGSTFRNRRILSVIGFLTIIPMILVRANQVPKDIILNTGGQRTESELLTWNVILLQNEYNIDVIFWFVVFCIIFLLFGLAIGTIGENILLEFEESLNKVKVNHAISLSKIDIKRPELKKPEFSIDEIKKHAKAKKDAATQKLEFEKKERIDKIMGKKNSEKALNPEIIRLEALIRNVKTILRSTPIHRVVSIGDIVNLLGSKVKTTPQEVESIILGLVSRNEVSGEFDIWKKEYLGGTPARRFIDETLESSPEFMKALNSIKIKTDGSVEFYFNLDDQTKLNLTKLKHGKKKDRQ